MRFRKMLRNCNSYGLRRAGATLGFFAMLPSILLLFGLQLLPLTALHAAPEPALVGHWSFAEGSGEVLHDKSGNKNDGVVHGASWVRVGDGFGLQFGANNSFVDFGEAV
jgi:hypothetical protein